MAITEKRKESMLEYAKNNLKRIPLDVQKEHYERIKAHAESRGEKVNSFIKRAIDETIVRDEEESLSMEAAQQLADELHDSPEHILQCGEYAEAVEVIDKIFPGSRKAILSHEFSALREKYAD